MLESDDEPQRSPTPEPMSEPEEDEDPPKPTGPSVRQRFRKTLTKLKITQQVTTKLKKQPVKKQDPRQNLGQKVALMGDGQAFGELALLNSNNKREASCVTETDVSSWKIFKYQTHSLDSLNLKGFLSIPEYFLANISILYRLLK